MHSKGMKCKSHKLPTRDIPLGNINIVIMKSGFKFNRWTVSMARNVQM